MALSGLLVHIIRSPTPTGVICVGTEQQAEISTRKKDEQAHPPYGVTGYSGGQY